MKFIPGYITSVYPGDNFKDLIGDMSDYMTSTPPAPGAKEVVMPGDLDFRIYDKRLAEGIPISDETWQLLVEAAQKVGVNLPENGLEGVSL